MEAWKEELYHHGILGQKWGKRNGPPYPLDASDHSSSEKKAGWRKSLDNDTLKTGVKVTTQTRSGIQSASNIARRREEERAIKTKQNARSQAVKEASEMSDEELRRKINRMNMEQQYTNLKSNDISVGRSRTRDILDTGGDILAAGASAMAIVVAINELRNK